jgi:sulfur carrier protein ThiS
MKKIILGIVIGLAVIGIGIVLMLKGNGNTASNSNTAAGTDLAAVPDDSHLLANLQSAGLDALSAEGTVLHIHQHIDLIINGQAVEVPAAIGIGSTFISPLHTHDTTGILHVESPVQKDFKLAQFFTEWGVTLSDTCIGSNCVDDTHKLIVAVNGTPVPHVDDIILKAHNEIEIWYGDKNATPELIKSYTFPSGL